MITGMEGRSIPYDDSADILYEMNGQAEFEIPPLIVEECL
jgi:hypothetical protein